MGGLRASLGMGMGAGFFMGPHDDRGHYHGEATGRGGAPNNPRRGDNRYNSPPPVPVPGPAYVYRRDTGVYDRRAVVVGGGEYRDQRINRAIAIGQGHGRVLNAWPQGGPLFVVRVDTPHGRVDMIIDVDTGRIVGER